MDMKKTGALISAQRKQMDLTQQDLAEKMQISVQAVSKWERGKSFPDASKLLELSEVLGLSVNELLSGEKIEDEHYKMMAEANLIEMRRKNESRNYYKYYIYTTDFVINILFFASLVNYFLNAMKPVVNGDMAWESLSPVASFATPIMIILCAMGVVAEIIYFLQERFGIINFMVEHIIIVSIGVKVVCLVCFLVVSLFLGGSQFINTMNSAIII